MRLLLLVTCVQCLLATRASESGEEMFSEEMLSKSSNSFENADITVSIKTLNGEKITEAFKATTNVKDPRKLRWVSPGLPRLLILRDRLNHSKVM